MIRVAGLREGNPPVTVDSPHKGPVTQILFPFDDVIMDSERREKLGQKEKYTEVNGLVLGNELLHEPMLLNVPRMGGSRFQDVCI